MTHPSGSLQVLARYTARDGDADTVAALLPGLAAASRVESGNLGYEVTRSLEDPRVFWIIERYRTADAFEAHRNSPHFEAIAVAQILPLLADRVVTELVRADDIP